MNVNALSVANYLIDIANGNNPAFPEKREIRQFGLMKRVYLVHGFSLALFDKSALDPRFDRVEAWKNGPVIPSVYHSFKHWRNEPITEKTMIADVNEGNMTFEQPILENSKIEKVTEIIWKRYLDVDDYHIIAMLHRSGTPWALCYEEGKNKEIPDIYTKAFYRKLVEYELG
jgi:uncharacterized phage-associated protein